jgi:hypothetical protein
MKYSQRSAGEEPVKQQINGVKRRHRALCGWHEAGGGRGALGLSGSLHPRRRRPPFICFWRIIYLFLFIVLLVKNESIAWVLCSSRRNFYRKQLQEKDPPVRIFVSTRPRWQRARDCITARSLVETKNKYSPSLPIITYHSQQNLTLYFTSYLYQSSAYTTPNHVEAARVVRPGRRFRP